jgi:hypothetical protein
VYAVREAAAHRHALEQAHGVLVEAEALADEFGGHPAQGQLGNDRTWLDTTWTAQFYGGSSDCSCPNRGGHPDRPNAVQSACREWGVGTGDHRKDRGMIKLLRDQAPSGRAKDQACA